MTGNRLKILRMLTSHLAGKGTSLEYATGMKWLLNEGFSPDEVDDACTWLKNLTLNSDLCMAIKDTTGNFYTNRVLSASEAMKIKEDAYGFLIRLRDLGLIDNHLQEEIIDMAMLSTEEEVGMDDIKGITAMLIFDHSPSQWKSDITDIINDRWEKIFH